MYKIIKLDPKKPETEKIKRAAEVINKGGLVIFPTETLYGLGANALDPQAVKKIFKFKSRSEKKPLIILIAKKSDLKKVAGNIPREAYILARKFWPGPLTLVLKKKKIIPKEVTAGGVTVAVRLSPHPVALALVREAGVPVTAPSANISGKKPHRTAEGVIRELGRKKEIDLILDAGITPLGKPSTILDLTQEPPKILREGSITKHEISKKLF